MVKIMFLLKILKLSALLLSSSAFGQDISIYDHYIDKDKVILEVCFEKDCYVHTDTLSNIKTNMDQLVNTILENRHGQFQKRR